MLDALLKDGSPTEIAARHANKGKTPLKPWIRAAKKLSASHTQAHWRTLIGSGPAETTALDRLYGSDAQRDLSAYSRNIENYIGTIQVPVGVIGPLRVNGLFAQDDFYVPLATTEAALVASYGRGARLISAAGGCAAAVLAEGVQRAPGFAFQSLTDAGLFTNWVMQEQEMLRAAAEATTRHGRLVDIAPHIQGDHVHLVCTFTTGDAAGQNMVTIATDALCRAIVAQCPVTIRHWFIEGNLSSDKKASSLSFTSVRGRKVCAEILLPADLIASHLHTTTQRMLEFASMSMMGGIMSGTIGAQGHYANGLAAIYLATGQDVACVAESAIGVTRFELRDDDALYASVTLPNIIVGTVGGGTGLPTQSAALSILGLNGAGGARALAEVCAALCLAGELSIAGAIAAGHFTRAHADLARGPA
jgi:hydroxymethylglutaryl-CoA reductase (NADPH)